MFKIITAKKNYAISSNGLDWTLKINHLNQPIHKFSILSHLQSDFDGTTRTSKVISGTLDGNTIVDLDCSIKSSVLVNAQLMINNLLFQLKEHKNKKISKKVAHNDVNDNLKFIRKGIKQLSKVINSRN